MGSNEEAVRALKDLGAVVGKNKEEAATALENQVQKIVVKLSVTESELQLFFQQRAEEIEKRLGKQEEVVEKCIKDEQFLQEQLEQIEAAVGKNKEQAGQALETA